MSWFPAARSRRLVSPEKFPRRFEAHNGLRKSRATLRFWGRRSEVSFHSASMVRPLRAAGAMASDVLCVLDLQSGDRRALELEAVGLKARFTTNDLQG